MTLFLYKLFIIRIPCQTIPWSASNTQLHFMKVINKILLVVSHIYLSTFGEQLLILQIVIFLSFLVTGIGRIFIIPHYSKVVDWITRSIELLSASLLLMVFLSNSIMNDLKLCIIIGILIIPGAVVASIILDTFRYYQLLRKLEHGGLRLEIEYEFILFLLIEMTRQSMGWDEKSAYSFSSILYLIDTHNRGCQNYQCPCHMRQIVQYLLNKGFTNQQNVVEIDEEEIGFLNSSGTDVFIQTDKNSQSSKTFTVFQINNFYQDYSDNRNQEIDSLKKQSVQINLQQLKLTFLNKFIEIYFDEAKKKFPGSKRLFFQFAYFTLYSCKNCYLTETLIRNFEYNKVNWIEKVSIKVNELQTVMEIRKVSQLISNHHDDGTKSNISWGIIYQNDQKYGQYGSKSYSTDSFEPEHFILMSLLTNKYYNTIEKLTQNIQHFWKKVQSDSLDVFNLYLDGVKVAKTIAKIYEVFKEIEEEGKRLDFRLYYVFALIQKFLLNDMIAHDMYINKMNSFRDMNRLIRSNLLIAKFEDTGIMLAHGSDKLFGKLILANQIFRKHLSYSQKDLKHQYITNFMPYLIKGWHASFVSDFNKSGINGILNRSTCVFVIKKNGYAIPAMMDVRFHYSKDYEFTFISFLTFMVDIQIQKNAEKHNVNEILFFLCDDIDGRICDVSESCSKQLSLDVSFLHSNDLSALVNHITIEDVCPTLSIRKLKDLRKQSDSLMAIEEIIDIDLNVIQGLNNGSRQHSAKFQKALCQVFQEQYGMNKDKCMNIVSITLLDQNEMKRYMNQRHKARQQRRDRRQQISEKVLHEEGKRDADHTNQGSSLASSIPGTQSLSTSQNNTSGSSRTGGSTETEILKQIYSSTEKKTSGSLRLIAQLIFIVFIIMIAISSINLILALDRNVNLVTEVNTVRKSYDRIAYHAKTRLLLRGMINMANGYEPLTSEINQQRFSAYQKELKNQIDNLKDVQDFLDKVDFDYSESFSSLVQSQVVQLSYLDGSNKIFHENQTHSYANNLYIQRISDIQNYNFSNLKGNISLMKIQNAPLGYKPTETERLIYFLITNAQDYLRYYDQIFSNNYKDETIQHALDVTSKTQITIIVSIISIAIVSLIISPIICRIEERKYLGLKFFIFVEHSYIAQLVQNCNDFLQLAFSDSSVHTGNTHQESNVVANKKKLRLLNMQNNFMDSNDQNQANLNQNANNNSESSSGQDGSNRNNHLDSNESSDFQEYASMYSQDHVNNENQRNMREVRSFEHYLINNAQIKTSNIHLQVQADDNSIKEQFQFNNAVGGALQNDNNLKIVQQPIESSLGTSSNNYRVKNTSQVNLEQSYNTLVNHKTIADNNDGKKQKLLQDQKLLGIKNIIYQQKLKSVILIGVQALLVSSYYIACYFLAEKSFSQTPDIIRYLDLLFFKDACLENSMAFVRENQILNKSISLIEAPDTDAASYFIRLCQERERAYIEMRKDLPAVFQEIKEYIETLETDRLCEVTYQGKEVSIEQCNSVYHGVLKNGLSYTMNVMLNHYMNLQLRFENDPAYRTKDVLLKLNSDDQTLRLAEVKDFILDTVFTELKDKATLSTTNYYDKLISYYKILFGIFVVALSFFILYFFIVAFKSIRDSMWRTNLTLKIMPMDFIPKECLPDLKKFFSS